MASSSVSSNEIILYDMFPGVATVNRPQADHSGSVFTNSDFHNVETAFFKPGYKVQVYEPTLLGWSIFTYLQSIAGAVAAAAGTITCYAQDQSWYAVTTDGDLMRENTPPAVALSAITTTYYGFFWTGGVCPQSFVTALATSTTITDDNVEIGPIGLKDLATPDQCGFAAAASGVNACGWLMSADT